MLGLRRGGVTNTAGELQRSGLIRYRGQLTIVDREGLEATACECHRIDHDGSSGCSDDRSGRVKKISTLRLPSYRQVTGSGHSIAQMRSLSAEIIAFDYGQGSE
jgi:hypothetical protein